MFGLAKKWELAKFKRSNDRLKDAMGNFDDRLESMEKRIKRHFEIHKQERCEHKNKSYSRSIYPPTFPGGHTQTLLRETCTDCDKTLSELFVIPGEAKDIAWKKRKLNYQKEILSKKLASVKEQIKALEKEKEK